MLDILISSLGQVFTFSHLLYMMLGIIVGLVVGIIPGLGGIAGMSLLLPFLYGMEPSVALGMLMGLVAVIPTGDTFASVLLGIPGSSATQATVIDGFALAKRGKAARALCSAFLSSMIGGLIGAVVLTGFILIARPLVLSFSSSELFMLTLLGLSMVAVLSGRDLFKGLAACGLGLLVGATGMAPATGEFRLNYGLDYLYDGLRWWWSASVSSHCRGHRSVDTARHHRQRTLPARRGLAPRLARRTAGKRPGRPLRGIWQPDRYHPGAGRFSGRLDDLWPRGTERQG